MKPLQEELHNSSGAGTYTAFTLGWRSNIKQFVAGEIVCDFYSLSLLKAKSGIILKNLFKLSNDRGKGR